MGLEPRWLHMHSNNPNSFAGAISIDIGSQARLTRVTISDCYASRNGGGLAIFGEATLEEVAMTNCSAGSAGSALHSDTQLGRLWATVVHIDHPCAATIPAVDAKGAYTAVRGFSVGSPGCNPTFDLFTPPRCADLTVENPTTEVVSQNSTPAQARTIAFHTVVDHSQATELLCHPYATCTDQPIAEFSTETSPVCSCTGSSYVISTAEDPVLAPYLQTEGCVLPVARDVP